MNNTFIILLVSVIATTGCSKLGRKTTDMCADMPNLEGCPGAVTPDAGADATMPPPCGGACPSDKPVCDTSTNTCVACLTNSDCQAPAVRCDLSTKTCSKCAEDCSTNSAKPYCNESSGSCVQCLPAGEAVQCNGKSCNPKTFVCTNTTIGTTTACNKCMSDTECISEFRCVPMTFQSMDRADGYCLKILSTGCSNPYRVNINNRASLSNPTATDNYCGIDESKTTCEAVHDLVADHGCPGGSDDECGVVGLADGLCKTVTGTMKKCTYVCSSASECPMNKNCDSPPAYCGN